ncbi:hypothetical protein SAY86_010014 [Trapa natans]|uniref:Zinc finger Mcm10/DnaG-type domain-containing protein n=1 Tax=Trapa natans TaxID=22666 RepID=A0AAN7L0M6_TRANT|nr:hypothetical protein SAY86_010014 [Trapa natans]
MSMHSQEDLDLLLSLQDRVLETPPASPSHSNPLSPGNSYLSDDGAPRRTQGKVDMSIFKTAVEDCLDYDTKSVKKENKTEHNNLNADPEVEKFSGLRIRQQFLSPAELSEQFSDIRFVRLSVIKNLLHGDNLSGCWATVGVLMEKGNPRTSSNGKTYSIWKVGSLNDDSLSLFLFGDAYQKNMNEKTGTVFALFNCNIRNDKMGGFSLSIFSPSQISKMGTSVDYGVCKGKKRDGKICTMSINKRQGIYCRYHRSKVSEKYSAIPRAQLQGGKFQTAYRDHLKSEGIHVVNPSVDRSKIVKVKQPLKLLTVEALRKALSGSDKLTTNVHAQGMRILNEVALTARPKNMNKEHGTSNQKPAEVEKRKASCLKYAPSSTERGQIGAKRTKAEPTFEDRAKQTSTKLIELEIYSSDDEE